jgi:3-carboxy-cis,cis-muconate cycloisomerase
MITARMASTPEMLACFDDAALVRAALAFERGLAEVLAAQGLIAPAAAAAIARACDGFDPAGLGDDAAHAGTLAIAIVARLRAAVGEHGAAVHHGATSQDLADTALVLQVRRAAQLLDADLGGLADALALLARAHAATPAIGRTLLIAAQPITVGARAAGWMLGVDAARARLARERLDQLQLGGAVGTLAALGPAGPAVRAALAGKLGLADGPAWHARRDAVAGLGAALAIATGAIGKLARDVALLMQLGEVAEPAIAGRGGSSAMPGKRNPAGCQVALAAAIRAPGLAASLLAGLPQELERGLGGWQAEAPVIGELYALAHGAARAMRIVTEGLEVHPAHVEADPDAVDAGRRFVEEALAGRR